MNSPEHKKYLKKIKKDKIIVIILQLLIIISFLVIWEILSNKNIINSFLFSSPSKVIKTIYSLICRKELFSHIGITLFEVIISFTITSLVSFFIAILMWRNKRFSKVIEPYLTILNALPKVALGPLIIIWIGAGTGSIIFMDLMISLFVSIINIYNGFNSTNKDYITLLKSLKANKKTIFLKVVLPSNKNNLINTMKVNVSMTLIGVIMGELLVSKKGLGYLIMYGSQVFNINLVITSIFILGIIAFIMYEIIVKIEKKKSNQL